MQQYPTLEMDDAVALVRSASQYSDALWIADADPRVAWIKLVGALEAAANRWDASQQDSPINRLRRHRPQVFEALEDCPDETRERVANDLAPTFKAVRKFRDFVLAFDPGPPSDRPNVAQFDWTELDDALAVIYDWRSRDLHDGIPFPSPLCKPPQGDEHGCPLEAFPGLAAAAQGGVWQAERLPMHLHLFAYIAGGCLRGWWSSL